MPSLSELYQIGQAESPSTGVQSFLTGFQGGMDKAESAKSKQFDTYLKLSQIQEHIAKTQKDQLLGRILKGTVNTMIGQGLLPYSEDEETNARNVANGILGTGNKTAGVDGMTVNTPRGKMATMIQDGNLSKFGLQSMDVNAGPVHLKYGKDKPPKKPKEFDPLAPQKEDRILREKALSLATKMAEQEDPLAGPDLIEKYLRKAYEYYGKDPDKYIPKHKVEVPNLGGDDFLGLHK
jgi:hypothetical protein